MDELLGKTRSHIIEIPQSKQFIHREVLEALLVLQNQAANFGFDLQVASGFRDYERQLAIWNGKAQGLRPLLDEFENALDFSQLGAEEVMWAILKWSAIPGFSRHHWGTEIDIYDRHAFPAEGYKLKLVPSESAPGGIFYGMHSWLDQWIEEERTEFYRPFTGKEGRVAIEPWHLSFRPVSDRFFEMLSLDFFTENIRQSSIILKEEILKNREEIYFNYILCQK